ncbi:MAG: class I SAM-dependent DNA methyltransferase, partial [Proteobacteria bacterium]|nr:class I SAM-dependent DNA methyltransferase [Pseudomonadota bacterium]
KKTNSKSTSFADLVWKPRVLIEMKKAGERLHLHQRQAFDYWLHLVPNRPRYVVLCNFNEFWIYDFDKQFDQPVDVVTLNELPGRYDPLSFLFPENKEPVFGNDREMVSRDAAAKVAELFHALVGRKIPRLDAQRFVLQLVVTMFAEDIDLLPANTVTHIVRDCLKHGQNAYDLFGGLFSQMNTKKPATAGRYKQVPYFNGGLFEQITPIELRPEELLLISNEENEGAADKNWKMVNPVIFGTIFQQSMDKGQRHAYGAHFTSEADIIRIVTPTIVRPFESKIAAAKTLKELIQLRSEIGSFRVLDPACGSGNFLFVAFRELSRLETILLSKIEHEFSAKAFEQTSKIACTISAKQFYGIEQDAFGVELAKVTLMLARKLACDEAQETLRRDQNVLDLAAAETLPLDNLDGNFTCGDALFADWPPVDTIIGNPPFQSKNKMQEEFGAEYLHRLREKHPDVPGRADYCVYWFRLTHDHLKPGQRAGLVGTNTIRQNYSREGGLDYIVSSGGTITEAVSSMPWSGEANVHVSIVNWIKGEDSGEKRLYLQVGNDPTAGWTFEDRPSISSALSFGFDVTKAIALRANALSKACHQGQTHGHEGFLLTPDEAKMMIAADAKNKEVIFPFLIANDLIGGRRSLPSRFVIDFGEKDLLEAKAYKTPFARVEKLVLPDRKEAAREEAERNKPVLKRNPEANVNQHHANFLAQWWRLSYRRKKLMALLATVPRYIACGRVTKRPIFDFVSRDIHPNDAVMVFPLADDYSFGVLQSTMHWNWFTERCSTLTERYRYTSNTVFDSFPWPQSPTKAEVIAIAKAARQLRSERTRLRDMHDYSLRDLYRDIDGPGDHPLDAAQDALDQAVRKAYGMRVNADPLRFLFELNLSLGQLEAAKSPITGPGLPKAFQGLQDVFSKDAVCLPK